MKALMLGVFFLCMSLVALVPSTVLAEEESLHTVTVTWDCLQPTLVTGFTLRVNGGAVFDVPGSDLREWKGTVAMHVGDNVFEMQAYDADGRYSEWSTPAHYTLKPNLLAPTDVKIEVVVTVKIDV